MTALARMATLGERVLVPARVGEMVGRVGRLEGDLEGSFVGRRLCVCVCVLVDGNMCEGGCVREGG